MKKIISFEQVVDSGLSGLDGAILMEQKADMVIEYV